ncbi:MAG: MobA/MobL family protein [Lachnospiraceae bacterium]|nr:MobA/MobL family protein [Lachnospiraceae bacterium]
MATNFTIRTSIVRASSGKCAVASAAYQSAEKLRDDRLQQYFCYRTKEEVVHTEILLPENAPSEFNNREILWNSVEKMNDRINARWARQFVIAVPNEWSRQESIERSRAFIKKEFVDKGMVADWAYHEKEGNHHLHVMCTTRAIGEDGKWLPMERKEYARDADGNKIPVIDPRTGEQKVRERDRNGVHTRELCWERITVQANNWNSKEQLREWKQAWAEHCNKYLSKDQQIDPRSYTERGIDRLPEIHEGPGARIAAERGEDSWRIEENQERRAINSFFEKVHDTIGKAREKISEISQQIKEWRQRHDKGRSEREAGHTAGDDSSVGRLPAAPGSDEDGAGAVRRESHKSGADDQESTGRDRFIDRIADRVSAGRRKLEELIGRNRTLNDSLGSIDDRKQAVADIARQADEIIEKRRQADERREQIRNALLGGVGGAADTAARGRTADGAAGQSEDTERREQESSRHIKH